MTQAGTCVLSLPTTGTHVVALVAIAVGLVTTGVTVVLWHRRLRALPMLALAVVAGCAAIAFVSSSAAPAAAACSTGVPSVVVPPGPVTAVPASPGPPGTIPPIDDRASEPPVPPPVVPEVPLPALLGLSAMALFGGASIASRRHADRCTA